MASRGQPFHSVANAPKRRSIHNLDYQKVFTAEFGQLIPIYIEPMLPGDTFRMTNDSVVRFAPLMAPIMHEINLFTHYFFVPYRLIWDKWEDFITGGEDGDNEDSPPEFTTQEITNHWTEGSLLDYIYDTLIQNPGGTYDNTPVKFPLMAYNKIYNDYYRDENLIEEVDIENTFKIQNRAWTKDYFTSALPFQQRGISPAMPIHIDNATLEPADDIFPGYIDAMARGATPPSGIPNQNEMIIRGVGDPASIGGYGVLGGSSGGLFPYPPGTGSAYVSTPLTQQTMVSIASRLKVDLDVISDWDINDLRTAWQTQRFLEAMARIGVRYTEYLQGIWNVSPRDERLQRPEYVGGTKQPIIISEVLQTSETTTTDNPLGRMGGHGITANSTRVGSYNAKEFGVMMGILSVMPKPSYSQGIDKRWMAKTRFDYPNPYFMHLSEQPIMSGELYYTGKKATDEIPFGFQGIWDEYRIKRDAINALMRQDSFAVWHLARKFPNAPTLSQTFIECDAVTGGASNPLKRIFAVPAEPGLFITSATRCSAIRPIPFIAEPGLVDH